MVELEGARFKGQASVGFLNIKAWFDVLLRKLSAFEDTLKSGTLNLFA